MLPAYMSCVLRSGRLMHMRQLTSYMARCLNAVMILLTHMTSRLSIIGIYPFESGYLGFIFIVFLKRICIESNCMHKNLLEFSYVNHTQLRKNFASLTKKCFEPWITAYFEISVAMWLKHVHPCAAIAFSDMAFNPGSPFGVPADRMFIRNHDPFTLMAYVASGPPGLEWSGQVVCGELAGEASLIPRLAVSDEGLSEFFLQAMHELREQVADANRQDLNWEDRIASIGFTRGRTFNNFRGHVYELRLSLTANACISGDMYTARGVRAGSIVAVNVAGVLMIRMPDDISVVALTRNLCSLCNQPDALQRCSRCHLARYCGIICQRRHWSVHRYVCDVGSSALRDVNALDRVTEMT